VDRNAIEIGWIVAALTQACVLLVAIVPLSSVGAQDRNPFTTSHAENKPVSAASSPANGPDFHGIDSIVYRLAPSSHLVVKTGKAGLFGFAGHSHVIQARAFTGKIVYYPNSPASSHLEITVPTDSLEVLTPPDTAEIRKVTATMRAEVLHTAQYPEIRLVSHQVTPDKGGFHVRGALTLAGRTREVPIDITVQLGLDTLKARTSFSVKQRDFGIKPYSGGPAGTVKVADRVTFDINAIATRAESTSIEAGRRPDRP
jgi:polyisoprenoid-binding protein YceI